MKRSGVTEFHDYPGASKTALVIQRILYTRTRSSFKYTFYPRALETLAIITST